MFILPFILLATQFSAIAATPLVARHNSHDNNAKGSTTKAVSATASATSTSAAASATATAGTVTDVTGTFGKTVALGGNVQNTDVLFTKGSIGPLEVEFQDVKANSVTVTENKTAGKAPTGFAFLETSSFKIALANGSNNLTLQKVDFIFGPVSEYSMCYEKDILLTLLNDYRRWSEGSRYFQVENRKAVHRYEYVCYLIDDAIGEQEFEADENEVTLTVNVSN